MSADSERREYSNPPIEEALCQVLFQEPLAWSVATPGKLLDALEGSYPDEPEVQEQLEAAIQLQPAHNNPANVALSRKDQRYVYRDSSKTKLLLVNANQLSVNSTRPYEGWPQLRQRLADALQAVNRITPLKPIQQVSLRYINRIVLPAGQIDSDDYFNIRVHTADSGKTSFRAFLNRVESMFEAEGVVAITTFATLQSQEAESPFLLDLDFQHPNISLTAVEEVLAVADGLNRLETREFENLIKDKTRELFQ